MKKCLFNKCLVLGGSFLLFSSFNQLAAQETQIRVDASKVENSISPYLYGSCIEDVNHEIYGGLYDQKIYGESFEEPVPGFTISGFTSYDGLWQPDGNTLAVEAFPGAKLVYDPVELANGSVETEIRFSKEGGDNAGLLVRVGNPGKGADRFDGYEISLTSNGSGVVFGKHRQNWQKLKEVQVSCQPREWNRLKVAMKKKTIEVFLNGRSLFVYEDKEAPVLSGKVALRTWNSDAEFRNLKVGKGKKMQEIPFEGKEGIPVSFRWDPVQTADAKAVFRHDNLTAYNGVYSQMIEKTGGSGIVGLGNSSLNRWGISVEKGQTLQGRIHLKGATFKGTVTLALQNAGGTKEYAMQELNYISDTWKKYPFTLTSNTTDPNARFVVYIKENGKLWVDQVVLTGTGDMQFHGLPYRSDIGKAMQQQGLTFLRYGGTMVNAPEYRFKKMIGDPDRRPPYKGHWNTWSTNGFGIEDFLKFCEAAGFEAAFAINIEETPEDAADMIEYLNGPVTSVWGKKRAENGHPKPYGVKYVEIGNEEVIHADDPAGYQHYIDRFNLLYEAMREKDPSVQFINSAWWRPDSPAHMEMVFKALNGKSVYWDYHPWADELTTGRQVDKELKQMQQLFLQWDPATQMKCAIFEENGNTHNMQRTLGHVTLQNAVRRNGDFVFTSCAANALQPYLQNDNGWDQGQIFFTPTQVWGMPPYYAQQMAAANHQPLHVFSQTEGNLDVTATRDEAGNVLVLHIANLENKPVSSALNIEGFECKEEVEMITLSGGLDARNTPSQPEKYVPVKQTLKKAAGAVFEFPAYSYTILKFTRNNN